MVATGALLGGLLGSIPASAGHDESVHSDNVKLITQKAIKIDKDIFAQGSDLAFQGRLIVAGTYEGTAFFKILKKGKIKQIGFHNCLGSQGDVSVWGKYAFVSIDSASTNSGDDPRCNNTDESAGKEGLRIIDISDPKAARQIKFVETPCGSHTHTLSPAGDTLYAYIESYPLGAPTATCSPASHRKVTIVKIPLSDPTKAEISGELDVSPAIGCHDLTTFPEKKIAIAACISESQVWDISDPAAPTVLAVINNPSIQVHHSASFTWDGKYAILSDEYGGAAGGGGCTGEQDSKVGAMYFYDITDPENPVLVGDYSLPRVPPADYQDENRTFRCTTHLYNILPMKDPAKYVAAASYYQGGISVVDFSDPAAEEEIGHYLHVPSQQLPDSWAAYWYNGYIYSNDHESSHGLRVFKMKGLGKSAVRYFKGRYNPQVQIPSFK